MDENKYTDLPTPTLSLGGDAAAAVAPPELSLGIEEEKPAAAAPAAAEEPEETFWDRLTGLFKR